MKIETVCSKRLRSFWVTLGSVSHNGNRISTMPSSLPFRHRKTLRASVSAPLSASWHARPAERPFVSPWGKSSAISSNSGNNPSPSIPGNAQSIRIRPVSAFSPCSGVEACAPRPSINKTSPSCSSRKAIASSFGNAEQLALPAQAKCRINRPPPGQERHSPLCPHAARERAVPLPAGKMRKSPPVASPFQY